MPTAIAETIAIIALVLSLGVAVARPSWLPSPGEATIAVPAAGLLVLGGVVPGHAALHTLHTIGPTVGFLAAILAFGHLLDEADVFTYLGSLAARSSRGQAPRLLALLIAVAAAVTAVLTLDATVVLLTPVVLGTVAVLRVPARPQLYVCTRIANSGSLLLPVSNLTNLLAFTASGLTFGRFAALMALPWVIAVAMEWLSLRVAFRGDLRIQATGHVQAVHAPRYALTVLGCTVSGFVIASALHIAPAWAALGGCVALLIPRVHTRSVYPATLLREASPEFCAFVLALAVIVDGVTRHGLGSALGHLVPSSHGLLALLAVAFLAAALANLVNNLPATLALVPLLAASPALMLAMLLGVNIGPNATYGGSLATMLWRRRLPVPQRPTAREFHLLGIATVPAILAVSTVALWAGVRTIGG